MLAKTYNMKGEVAGQIELPKDLFEVKVNPDLVYQVAVTQMANRRQGNANSKGRGEVSGGGKKPWRQRVPAGRATRRTGRRYGATAAWFLVRKARRSMAAKSIKRCAVRPWRCFYRPKWRIIC